MRISDIKYKAEEVLQANKSLVIKVFILIGSLSAIFSYISNILPDHIVAMVASLCISIITLTLSHGYVVTSLKAVNNRYEEIDVEKDGLTGFYRFKQLFGTYFIYSFFLFMIIFVLLLIGFVVIRGIISDSTINELRSIVSLDINSYVQTSLSHRAVQEILNILGFFLFYFIFVLAVIIVYSANFSLTFFILEKYQIKGVDAMKQSMQLMKGYKRTYCLLYLSFLGWIILVGIIQSLLAIIIPVTLVTSIIGVMFANVLYNTKLQVSLAVLYEEIDLSKYVKVENEV